MVCQALLLLTDIEFLDVVDQLLLQTILVVVHPRNLLQTLHDALLDLLHATLLVGLDLCQQHGDIIDLLGKLLLKGCTFLCTEIHQILQGLAHGVLHRRPLFVGQLLCIRLCQHVRHTEQSVEPVIWYGDARLLRDTPDLLIIILHECRIDGGRVDSHILLYPDAHVDFSSDKGFGYHLAHLHLLLAIKGCNTCVQVKLLGVQRLHLYMDFLVFVSYDSFAVACH